MLSSNTNYFGANYAGSAVQVPRSDIANGNRSLHSNNNNNMRQQPMRQRPHVVPETPDHLMPQLPTNMLSSNINYFVAKDNDFGAQMPRSDIVNANGLSHSNNSNNGPQNHQRMQQPQQTNVAFDHPELTSMTESELMEAANAAQARGDFEMTHKYLEMRLAKRDKRKKHETGKR